MLSEKSPAPSAHAPPATRTRPPPDTIAGKFRTLELEPLDQAALDRLLAAAEPIEVDERGVKVAELADGDFIKVFRVRDRLSSARLRPYAQRFCENAWRLQQLGYRTVEVRRLYRLDDGYTSAVIYTPVAGYTVRQLIMQQRLHTTLPEELGQFIAALHHDGILFRSLHMGNVVVMADGQFALIDISDMQFFAAPLSYFQRLRNWRHIKRYKSDFGVDGISREAFLTAYAGKSKHELNLLLQLLK